MALPDTLRTHRLLLRRLEPSDAEALVLGLNHYEVARWLGKVPYPYDAKMAEGYIARRADDQGVWAIIHDGQLVGIVSFRDQELGYWIARQHWGQGYATDAIGLVIDAHFSSGANEMVRAGYAHGNARSQNVLRKLGFQSSGVEQRASVVLGQDVDVHMMTLSREAWEDRQRYALKTPRLLIRPLVESDAMQLARIGGDPRVAPMMASIPRLWPVDSARARIVQSQYRGRPGFLLAITRHGRLIGALGLGRVGAAYSCVYFIDPAYWGRGFATEAMGYFLADILPRLRIDEIMADHFYDNPASGAVLRKLGFEECDQSTGRSAARVEAAPVIVYRLKANALRAVS